MKIEHLILGAGAIGLGYLYLSKQQQLTDIIKQLGGGKYVEIVKERATVPVEKAKEVTKIVEKQIPVKQVIQSKEVVEKVVEKVPKITTIPTIPKPKLKPTIPFPKPKPEEKAEIIKKPTEDYQRKGRTVGEVVLAGAKDILEKDPERLKRALEKTFQQLLYFG